MKSSRASQAARSAGRLLLALALLLAIGCSQVTEANFAKIEDGMTQADVAAILGSPTDSKSVGIGPLSGTNSTWKGRGVRINIKFVNDQVVLKSLKKGSDGEN